MALARFVVSLARVPPAQLRVVCPAPTAQTSPFRPAVPAIAPSLRLAPRHAFAIPWRVPPPFRKRWFSFNDGREPCYLDCRAIDLF
ncbi:hypothetical protein QBC39DRAFT_360966 [Podospora conica]|nr:hypothetical protein QBC39DRAFT_360966 [Schizothecium conicum]